MCSCQNLLKKSQKVNVHFQEIKTNEFEKCIKKRKAIQKIQLGKEKSLFIGEKNVGY